MSTNNDPNNIAPDTRAKLAALQWSPNNVVDLHALGVHYFTPNYLPTYIDALTYSSCLHRGLTPPMTLPIHVPDDTQARIKKFLEMNFFRLANGGVQYLGNEFNVQTEDDWDKTKIKVCLVRLSDYKTLDGAFGGFLINNFIQDFTDDIFVDFAWFPETNDISKIYANDLPLLWGNITKRPLTDFDVIIIATSYPGERVNIPTALVKSGIPLYRWERWADNLPYKAKTPIVALAGIGSAFIENMLGDNPKHGNAANASADFVLIGEGEMMDLKFIQQYQKTVIEGGGTKEDFRRALTNENHTGAYDPSLVLFEYADKVHTTKDHTGKVIDTQTYKAGGQIKSISILDYDGKVKYAMAGPDSEEFQDMQAINDQFLIRFKGTAEDNAELGQRYVKVSDKPTRAQRTLAGVLKAPDPATGTRTIIGPRG